jgi:hypothetical protein
MRVSADTQAAFADAVNVATFFLTNSCMLSGLCPVSMQIGHRCEVVHQVNRQAALEQPVPPRLDRNVLKGDRAAKRLRIFLCIEMHVLGLRAGQRSVGAGGG